MSSEIEALHEQIRQLQDQLAARQLLQLNPATPPTPTPQTDPAERDLPQLVKEAPRGPKPGNPSAFHGDIDEFDIFISEVQNVFRLQRHLFQSDEEKIAYASSFMKGRAKRWWITHETKWVDCTNGQQRTWGQFKEELSRVFGCSTQATVATDRMTKLRQEGSLAKIDDYLAEALLTDPKIAECRKYLERSSG